MSIEMTSAFLLIGLLGLMACGVPIGFSAGALAMLIAYINFGSAAVSVANSAIYSLATEYLLVSVPMFILMASLLERSALARDLYSSLQRLVGGSMRGGVAVVTLLLSVILAAMSGIIGGEIVLLGLVALPQMLRLHYDRRLAIGVICAGGSLGTMIPPSVVLIVFGLVAEVSVRELFLAAVVPGLLLALIYFTYVAARCLLNPSLAPALSSEMKAEISVPRALVMLLPALGLVMLVMALIYGGVTSVTEASGIGAVGALILIVLRGEFSWRLLNESLVQTLRACGIILWVTFGASVLVSVYNLSGGRSFFRDLILSTDLSPLGIIGLMMLCFFLLGTFMDWIGIVFLTIPIFVPIVTALGFDPVWFGILFCVSMQVSFLSPPFAPAAFVLKSVAPPHIKLVEIFQSLLPFIALQLVGLTLIIFFPELALWYRSFGW
ncbi:MAG: TRAP transporter large permease subunit [Rhizobiaceae bacterium]